MLRGIWALRIRTALSRLAGRVSLGVEDLPPELDACECACRETECSLKQWVTCERRLRLMEISQAGDDGCRSGPSAVPPHTDGSTAIRRTG